MPHRTPRTRPDDRLWLGYRMGSRQRLQVRRATLLTGVFAAFLLLWEMPWQEPAVRLVQGVTLLLTAWFWGVLTPLTGHLCPLDGRLCWAPRGRGAAPDGPCRIVACLPGAVALSVGWKRRYRWVFRDEMTQEHWRRLHLLARFSDQNRIRRAR